MDMMRKIIIQHIRLQHIHWHITLLLTSSQSQWLSGNNRHITIFAQLDFTTCYFSDGDIGHLAFKWSPELKRINRFQVANIYTIYNSWWWSCIVCWFIYKMFYAVLLADIKMCSQTFCIYSFQKHKVWIYKDTCVYNYTCDSVVIALTRSMTASGFPCFLHHLRPQNAKIHADMNASIIALERSWIV